MFRNLVFIVLSVAWAACSSPIENLKTFGGSGELQAVIEMPAGTNAKREYNPLTHTFEVDKRNQKERIIRYLPSLGNYGFVPGTCSATDEGGDGDPVDILVLCESLPLGTVVRVKPLTMLRLIDNGEQDYKIIAVPLDSARNVLKIETYDQLQHAVPGVLNIIETWFLNYDTDSLYTTGWASTEETLRYIKSNEKPCVH